MRSKRVLELFSAMEEIFFDGIGRAEAVFATGRENSVWQGGCNCGRTAQESLWGFCGIAGNGG